MGQEEPIKESKDEEYISDTKKYIDDFISKTDYRKAFLLLVVFMGNLDDIEKKEVIEYYNDHLVKIGVLHKRQLDK
jgi:hypothetical protein